MMGPIIDTAEFYQSALDASATAILIVDGAGTIVLVNGALERQFAYTREELVGHSIERLFPGALPVIHAGDRGSRTDSCTGELPCSRELVGRLKHGSPIAVEMTLQPFPAPEGMFVLATIAERQGDPEETPRAALEERLEFERFVAELSFRFINLPDERVNDAIRSGLDRVCDQFEIDRSTFYRIDPDGVLFDPVSCTASGIPPLSGPVPAKEQFPWTLERILGRQVLSFSTLAELPGEVDQASYRQREIKSAVDVPLAVEGRVVGVVEFDSVRVERTWSPEVLHRLEVIGSVFNQLLASQLRTDAVAAALREIQRLKDELHVENAYLRREEQDRLGSIHVVGQSAAVRGVLEQIHQVAPTDSTVLLLGETGTGKELFANQIHELGKRQRRAMVRVNCAAIPTTLIESELFGREKGAFTGALTRQVGRFELADQSTIFLDEIGDLPADIQVKLLRVLEERTIERLGSPRPIAVDVRVIAATHRNLEQRVSDGTFRQDLYYRLNVFPIKVPPLRERVEDIPPLVWRFVEEFSKALGKRIDAIEKDTMTALQQYAWPGNVRELRNLVERAMIGATTRRLSIALPLTSASGGRRSSRLIDVEKEHIRAVLESTGWRVRGTRGAAAQLGLKPTTLETRMAKLGLKRPGHV